MLELCGGQVGHVQRLFTSAGYSQIISGSKTTIARPSPKNRVAKVRWRQIGIVVSSKRVNAISVLLSYSHSASQHGCTPTECNCSKTGTLLARCLSANPVPRSTTTNHRPSTRALVDSVTNAKHQPTKICHWSRLHLDSPSYAKTLPWSWSFASA